MSIDPQLDGLVPGLSYIFVDEPDVPLFPHHRTKLYLPWISKKYEIRQFPGRQDFESPELLGSLPMGLEQGPV